VCFVGLNFGKISSENAYIIITPFIVISFETA
jgi:hypothetical protein